jgi:hypothetical protein
MKMLFSRAHNIAFLNIDTTVTKYTLLEASITLQNSRILLGVPLVLVPQVSYNIYLQQKRMKKSALKGSSYFAFPVLAKFSPFL